MERATRSRDLGASRGHALMTALSELVRCRAALRLGLTDDAVRALAVVLDLTRVGDMEADEEVAEGVIMTGAEVVAAFGDVALAGRLEAARRRIIDRRRLTVPDVDESHDQWLASLGVPPGVERGVDVPSALALIREWVAAGVEGGQRGEGRR